MRSAQPSQQDRILVELLLPDTADVYRLVTGKLFDKGRRLMERGAVLKIGAGDESLVGVVLGNGSTPHELEVGLDGRGDVLFSMCTCLDQRELLCKHAVAALLQAAKLRRAAMERCGAGGDGRQVHDPGSHHEADRAHGTASAGTAPSAVLAAPAPNGSGSEPRTGPALRPGMPPERLAAWAKEHGVSSWLERDAGWAVNGYSYGYGYPTLVEAVTGKRRAGGSVSATMQAQAVAFLGRRAVLQARAREEERERLAAWTPPADPVLAAAYERLLALRRGLREHIEPLPGADREHEAVAPQADPPAVRYTVTRPPGDDRHGAYANPKLTVLLGDEGETAVVRCTCEDLPTAPGRGPCPLALSAVDAALDVLCRPQLRPTAEHIRRALLIPPWKRALAALDAALASAPVPGPTQGGEPAQLGWEICRGVAGLDVHPLWCRPKARGKGLKVARRSLRSLCDELSGIELPADGAIVDLLGWRESASYHSDRAAGLMSRVIELLVGHPRVFWSEGGRSRRPVAVRRGTVSLRLEADAEGGARLAGEMFGRAASLEELTSRMLADRCGSLLVHCPAGSDVCWLARAANPTALLAMRALSERPDRFPDEALEPLLGRLQSLSAHLPLELGESLSETVACDPTPRVRLELDTGGALQVSLRVAVRPGMPALVPGEGTPSLLVRDGERVVQLQRDLAAERVEAERIASAAGLSETEPAGAPLSWCFVDLERSLAVLEALQSLDGVVVEWASPHRRQVGSAGAGTFHVAAVDRRDWFGLEGGLELDGHRVPLGALLAALREGKRFVAVTDELWVRIDEALRARLEPIDLLARSAKGDKPVEVPRVAVPLLAEVAREEGWLDGGGFQAAMSRMEEAGALDIALPEGFAGTLRPYQRVGFEWLARLAHWAPGACLADDMGLGKTIQALALLARRSDQGPALVVAPTSVGFGWEREAARFAPRLEVRAFRGRAHLDRLAGLGPGDLVVTSYDLVARYAESLAAQDWATLVLDESQAIKNPDTQRAGAVFDLKAAFVLALTGTPVENRTGELWSLFQAIAPGLLGNARQFRARFAVPIERDGDAGRRALLARLIRPFVLRRLKGEVAPELPERTEVRLDVDLSRAERHLYDGVRLAVLADLAEDQADREAQRRIQVLAALTRMRQAACHPRLLDPTTSASSAKLTVLGEILQELVAEGHQALVFSQFTSLLALVQDMLKELGLSYRYLDGATPAVQRKREVDAFQAGQAPVFLLSLKAGGTGLNLTAADYVIHLDPWWNPAVEDQATDRAHRIGQTRPVTVYRLVARDTIEEAVLALHGEKRELVEALLDGTNHATSLNSRELLALIQGGRAEGEIEEAQDDEPRPAAEASTEALAADVRKSDAAVDPAHAAGTATPPPVPIDELVRALEEAVGAERISAGTARTYLRVANRLVSYARQRGLAVSEQSVGAVAADYAAALCSANPGVGPISDRQIAPVVAGWLGKALADVHPPSAGT